MSTVIVKNNVVIRSGTGYVNSLGGGSTLTASHNATDKASVEISGSSNVADLVPKSTFYSPADKNYRIRHAGGLMNVGTDVSGVVPTDALGTSRPQRGGWDIGAVEYDQPGIPEYLELAAAHAAENTVDWGTSASAGQYGPVNISYGIRPGETPVDVNKKMTTKTYGAGGSSPSFTLVDIATSPDNAVGFKIHMRAQPYAWPSDDSKSYFKWGAGIHLSSGGYSAVTNVHSLPQINSSGTPWSGDTTGTYCPDLDDSAAKWYSFEFGIFMTIANINATILNFYSNYAVTNGSVQRDSGRFIVTALFAEVTTYKSSTYQTEPDEDEDEEGVNIIVATSAIMQ